MDDLIKSMKEDLLEKDFIGQSLLEKVESYMNKSFYLGAEQGYLEGWSEGFDSALDI